MPELIEHDDMGLLRALPALQRDAARYRAIRAALLSGGPEWSKLAALLNIAPDTTAGVDDAVDVALGVKTCPRCLGSRWIGAGQLGRPCPVCTDGVSVPHHETFCTQTPMVDGETD